MDEPCSLNYYEILNLKEEDLNIFQNYSNLLYRLIQILIIHKKLNYFHLNHWCQYFQVGLISLMQN